LSDYRWKVRGIEKYTLSISLNPSSPRGTLRFLSSNKAFLLGEGGQED